MERRQFLGLLSGTVLAAPLTSGLEAEAASHRLSRLAPSQCFVTQNSTGYLVMERRDGDRTWEIWQTADDGLTWEPSSRSKA